MTVTPGFDVGAYIHTNGEEMFDVVDGEIDVGRTPARHRTDHCHADGIITSES